MSGNVHVRLREKGGGQKWPCCTLLSSSMGSALFFLGEYANMILTSTSSSSASSMEEKQSSLSGSETESDSPPAVSRATGAQAVSAALSLGNAGTTEAATPGNVDSLAKMKGKMPEKRPREYDAEGNLILSSAGVRPPEEQLGTTPFSSSSSSSSSSKRGRGRPPAGDRQRLESIGKESKTTAAGIFKPLVLTVKTGEDVAGKILSFAQMVP